MAKTLYTFKRHPLAEGWMLEDGEGEVAATFDTKDEQALGYGDGGIPFYVSGHSVEVALISGDGGWITSLVAAALDVDPDDIEVTDVRDDVHGNVFDLTTEWTVSVTDDEGQEFG